MKEKVFYVVNETETQLETETRRERRFLNLRNFERATRTCSSRSSECICKSKIDAHGLSRWIYNLKFLLFRLDSSRKNGCNLQANQVFLESWRY